MIRFIRMFSTALVIVCAQTMTPIIPVAVAGEKGDPTSSTQAGNDTFQVRKSTTARTAKGATPSKIKATKAEAALRLFVLGKDDQPMEGIVISLVSSDGAKYYTEETDSKGYAEALVPIGKTYQVNYLSLGESDVSKRVTVDNKAYYTLKLTLRYTRIRLIADLVPQGLILKGVQFETGSARLTGDSFARLDRIVEYLKHKKSSRIEISGHTDNVGSARRNTSLSKKRANACRDYLVSKGIERARIVTVGSGDKRPVASNETKEGRQQNRRIEAVEL